MATRHQPHQGTSDPTVVRIELWTTEDFPLLEQLNSPEMTLHLGGPESAERLADRQRRYVQQADSSDGRMFKIVLVATGQAVGSIGYWRRIWRGSQVYEMGWGVLPPFQGKGIARAATTQAIARARDDGAYRFLHAFPGSDNPPSNALCRALGFALIEECDFEYPAGKFMRCNDWRLDLRASHSDAGVSEAP